MDCPSCSTQLAADSRFCQRCGAPAPAAPAEPSDPLRDALKVALGRQYEVSRLLGKGGMGAVYLAREAALERDVAIKVLPPDRGDTQDSRDRFRREARTAAKLSHANIVPLYTFGDVDGTLYFVMGYVKGESLATRLKREGKLPVEESRRILIEIAEALDYAHKLGIVHRDIKPDNVLIEEGTGRAMLTDFGIAKALGAGQTMTTAGSVIGTPQYMSPEQAQGKADIDARSDLYSLGVMGYAMLAGRLPFEGSTPGDVMVQHITKEPPTLVSLAAEVPVELASALTRCLAKDRNKRWLDAQSLRRGLTNTAEGAMPEDMVEISTWTQVLLGTLVLWGLMALRGALSIPDQDPIALHGATIGNMLPWPVVWIGLGWLLGLYLRHRKGHTWREVFWCAFAKPSWWPGAYPARLRLPGDVWLRLPATLRRLRTAAGNTILFSALLLIIVMCVSTSSDTYRRTGEKPAISKVIGQIPRAVALPLSLGASALLFATLFAYLFYFWKWTRHVQVTLPGLGSFGANRMLWGDTTKRSFWSRTEIAALLLPEGTTPANSTTPTSAPEMVSAISIAVARLDGDLATIGVKARDAGRDLAQGIAAIELQISALAGSVDAAEADRLAAKIVVLGPAMPSEAAERQQMRDLFQKQLDLLRGLQARLEGLKTRRARRMELLRGLWLHAVELQAAAGDRAKAGDTPDRIKKLFGQIDEHIAELRPGVAGDAETHPLAELPTIQK